VASSAGFDFLPLLNTPIDPRDVVGETPLRKYVTQQ